MAKKKLKLEILDPKGKTIRTHHFFYEVSGGKGSRLRLTLNDNTYVMDGDGKLVILTQDEIEVEEKHKLTINKEWADNLKTRLDNAFLFGRWYRFSPATRAQTVNRFRFLYGGEF